MRQFALFRLLVEPVMQIALDVDVGGQCSLGPFGAAAYHLDGTERLDGILRWHIPRFFQMLLYDVRSTARTASFVGHSQVWRNETAERNHHRFANPRMTEWFG